MNPLSCPCTIHLYHRRSVLFSIRAGCFRSPHFLPINERTAEQPRNHGRARRPVHPPGPVLAGPLRHGAFDMSLKRRYPRTEVEEGAKHACCFLGPDFYYVLGLVCWEVGEAWEAGDDWQMT